MKKHPPRRSSIRRQSSNKPNHSQTAEPVRIQKLLAQAGYGSRRQLEQQIDDGLVKVNGKIATLGDKASTTDRITLNGRLLKFQQRLPDNTQVLIYHKPVGEVCTRKDPEGRPIIFHQLPKLHQGKWISIGRLDINTSGLLLLTNDGHLANQLMHPKYAIERVYKARVLGKFQIQDLQTLTQPTQLDNGDIGQFSKIEEDIHPDTYENAKFNRWLTITLTEGKYREVRRMLESKGLQVNRLIRVQYANIKLTKALRPGRYDLLSDNAIKQLQAIVDTTHRHSR